MTLPKTIGACADALYEVRKKRLEAQKVVERLSAEENELREHIIKTLPKSQASGAAGRLARVQVVTREVPQVEDWDKFYQYVSKTKQFDLIQRRVSDRAVQERWEEGEKVPGVKVFNLVSVSVNKL